MSFRDALNVGRPPPNHDRTFELRITDLGTRRIYAYSLKVKGYKFTQDPGAAKTAMIEGFIRMVDALFRGEALPEANTQVVD